MNREIANDALKALQTKLDSEKLEKRDDELFTSIVLVLTHMTDYPSYMDDGTWNTSYAAFDLLTKIHEDEKYKSYLYRRLDYFADFVKLVSQLLETATKSVDQIEALK